MSIAEVGHEISVGSSATCDELRGQFALAIHIRYPGQTEGPGLCRMHVNPGPDDMAVTYTDMHSLADASATLDEIAEFARRPGRLLIHCAAGICRSPTLAIVAKVARGCGPFDAYRDVAAGLWRGYRTAPLLHHKPMSEILAWATKGASQ